jgi:hypothetical protein
MPRDFLENFAAQGFDAILHGDIHEAVDDVYEYDSRRRMHIIGAGTFGSRPEGQVPGIPLQYNVIAMEHASHSSRRRITIYSRKREKINGAWCADPRWGEREHPEPCRTETFGRGA